MLASQKFTIAVVFQEASEGQTLASTEEEAAAVETSYDAKVEVPRRDDEEEPLIPLTLLTTYNGQFDYIVPSENALPEANIAEVRSRALLLPACWHPHMHAIRI